MMTSCIYHSDKVGFDKVRKDLQKAKILPRNYSPRLAMAVCSCRKKETSISEESQGDISDELSFLRGELRDSKWDLFQDTRSYIWNALNFCDYNESQKKLLLIIYKGLHKNYDALISEIKLDPKYSRVRRHTMNKIGHARMIRRKQRAYQVKGDITLPIFGGNSKELEKDTGPGFSKYGKQFDCVICFDSDKTREYMNSKQQKTVVTVWCQSKDTLHAIQTKLCALANNIQVPITARHERFQESRRAAFQNFNKKHTHSESSKLMAIETERKNLRTDDFLKKKHCDNKNKSSRQGLSPLHGGHCRNCMKPFDSLKSSKDVCKYHNGYQVLYADNVWSCCYMGNDVAREKSVYEVHRDTGCCTGQHVWRPHHKTARGDKSERHYIQKLNCKRF